MKYVRAILLFFAISFGFVMQAEIYQNMLWNFNGAYYLASRYTEARGDMDAFLLHGEEIAEKHNVHIFSASCVKVSNTSTRLTIYGDDEIVRDSLKRTMDLEEKNYTSLIGGITTVEFKAFCDAKNSGNEQDILISYVGSEEDVTAAYQDLAQNYSLTQPDYWQSKETDMMIIVWGLVAILMTVLNVVEVIRRQKEVVVRVSLGESAAAIALKSAMIDLASYAALLLLARLLTSLAISGSYEKNLILIIFCAGSVLSVLPYLAFLHFDVRKAFSNASDRKGMLCLMNGLSVLAAALTVFTITTNLSSIHGNLLTSSDLLEQHDSDFYFSVILQGNTMEEDLESAERTFWDELYDNEYNTINPVICIGSQIGDAGNYIFVNYNAKDMLQGFGELLTEENEAADIVVFIPEDRNAESYQTMAGEQIDALVKHAENLNIVYQKYSSRETFYYLNSNREDAVDGLSRVTNPVVIYQANGAVALNGSAIETMTYNPEVIYACEEIALRNAAQTYAGQLGSHYFVLSNTGEDYAYCHSFLVKLISFVSSLCVLVLLLDLAVILSEVKLEFRLHAMEISLRKVLGYSFYERHKGFLIVHLAENIAVTILICVATLFLSSASAPIALLIGILLTIAELTIIFANILWVEQANVSKSLKGGCL